MMRGFLGHRIQDPHLTPPLACPEDVARKGQLLQAFLCLPAELGLPKQRGGPSPSLFQSGAPARAGGRTGPGLCAEPLPGPCGWVVTRDRRVLGPH